MEARYKVAMGIIKPIQQESFKRRERETLHTHTHARAQQLTADRKILRTLGPRAGYSFYSPKIVSQTHNI